MLHGKPAPGTVPRGLDLVGDQQGAVTVAKAPQLRPVRVWRHDDPAVALNRLGNHSGNGAAPEELFQGWQALGMARPRNGVGREQRIWVGPPHLQAGHAHRPLGSTVQAVLEIHYTRPGASTFGGNLVSCRAALATLAFHQQHRLGQRSSALGERLRSQLLDMQKRRPEISEIRGRGLMIGVELRESATPIGPTLTDTVLELMKDAGFLLGKTGPARNVLTLMPPLVVTSEALDSLVDALEQALRAARGCVKS